MNRKPLPAFFMSFAAGLALLFGGQAALTSLMTPTPDVQIGPLPTI